MPGPHGPGRVVMPVLPPLGGGTVAVLSPVGVPVPPGLVVGDPVEDVAGLVPGDDAVGAGEVDPALAVAPGVVAA
ncbi:hypothetical protein PZ938_15030 [Luteipulveratus sp. YIM 133132]|nr:hypothetical protein [Luteipulveratus sp. YIM 133132]MDE9366927.1 hypothetical protein [Luteipulveratus sp. YIM 133132]